VKKLALSILVGIVALALMVSACAPAATPTPAAEKPAAESKSAPAAEKPATESKGATPATSSKEAAAASKEPIVIGLVTSVTGGQAATGENQTAGIKMAIEEWNQKGGVNGRPIELAVEDDASNPTGAVNAFNKLISTKKPVAVIGPNYTNSIMAMEPYIKQAAIPVVTGANGVPITASGNPWFFRVLTNSAVTSELLVNYVVNDLGYKKIGIIYINGEYGQSTSKVVQDDLAKLGVTPVRVESYNPDDKDLTAQLLNLDRAGAEIVIGLSYPPDAGLIMTSVSQLGLKMKLLGNTAFSLPEALNIAKEAANGHYLMVEWMPSDDPAIQAWVKKIEARQKQPANYIDAAYYDGTNMLLKAIETAGTDPQAIRKAMLATKGYKGITGEYSFDEHGDGLRQLLITQVKDQKLVLVKVVKGQ